MKVTFTGHNGPQNQIAVYKSGGFKVTLWRGSKKSDGFMV